ncbi:MAG: hypothetical protein AOA65_0220 [Candidatus Bathyarchaeota archaeon BA1]|nr:MAG: hypothetical protein AOA65_0220 [Candidatus Bathyarchaeota archaeon BA1]
MSEEKKAADIVDLLSQILKLLLDHDERIKYINDQVTKINNNMVTKEVFTSEMKLLTTKVEAVDRRVDDWRDSTKTYFTVLGIIVAIAGILVPVLIRIFP